MLLHKYSVNPVLLPTRSRYQSGKSPFWLAATVLGWTAVLSTTVVALLALIPYWWRLNLADKAPQPMATWLRTIGSGRQSEPAKLRAPVASHSVSSTTFKRKSSRLRVSGDRARPAETETAARNLSDHLGVGSTEQQVVGAQGAPNRRGESVWEYGSSTVYYSTGDLTTWHNIDDDPLKLDIPAFQWVDGMRSSPPQWK